MGKKGGEESLSHLPSPESNGVMNPRVSLRIRGSVTPTSKRLAPLGVLICLLGTLIYSFDHSVACADVKLADGGKARVVIVIDAAASAPERVAANELAAVLHRITGATFEVQTNTEAPGRAILVGRGVAARKAFKEVNYDSLGDEELVIKTRGNRLLLAGGSPRGTLYAVSRFLQTQCGVRWWTPWASRIPQQRALRIPDIDVREKPAFEYREPYWYPAFDADWSWRNRCNGQGSQLPAEKGGRVNYKGFVHTFYPLVPPEKHFAAHPEWFSLIKGKRTTDRAQLCLTNPELRRFLLEQVRQWLRESPDTGILSVSQNDWYGACECPDCKALDDAEGSHAGTMLSLVNYIAEQIEPEFPKVAIDTLAYQYTRKPPKTLVPRSNVIIRLCSIECNFRESLEHESNRSFAEDIRGWSKICQRLYIWDYTTDFSHYVQPHPNWHVLDQNLRFFHANGVRGVFEQGAYQSHGSEMAEMRAWVLAQLMWNPKQDGQALIREFLEGYYGPAATPHLLRYFELMREATTGHKLGCFAPTERPYFGFKTLQAAEELWLKAESAASVGDAEFLERVRLGHLPVRYVLISRWDKLRKECSDLGAAWPFPATRAAVIGEWLKVAQGLPNKPWTKISLLNEAGLTPEKWAAKLEGKTP